MDNNSGTHSEQQHDVGTDVHNEGENQQLLNNQQDEELGGESEYTSEVGREEEEGSDTYGTESEYYNSQKPTTPYGGSRILYVEVEKGDEIVTENCEVVNQCIRKPFLGGYRHRETLIEYHHASCQTDALPRKRANNNRSDEPVPRSHRCTQTVKTKSVSQQTLREQGTQMAKPGLAIDNSNDRIYICTGRYFSADQLESLRIEKAIFLQAWIRGCLARKRCKSMHEEKVLAIQKEKEAIAEQQKKEHKKAIREQQRREHPKSQKDFEILYNELEDWRLSETARIKRTSKTKAERRLGMIEVLRKETKVLQVIDRLKHTAAKENQKKHIAKKLEKMANPKVLKNYDGEVTLVETPFTVRAAELMDLYHSLNTANVSVDERLDVLLHVKWTVKEFDCILTRDIVELIDREGDMLNRGRSDRALEGLRKRLANLFLQFIETPEFNPLASNLKNASIQFANVQPIEK